MNISMALVITVEPGVGGWGHDVYLNGQMIGHRSEDGIRAEEIPDEVATALTQILHAHLDWNQDPEEDEYQ